MAPGKKSVGAGTLASRGKARLRLLAGKVWLAMGGDLGRLIRPGKEKGPFTDKEMFGRGDLVWEFPAVKRKKQGWGWSPGLYHITIVVLAAIRARLWGLVVQQRDSN